MAGSGWRADDDRGTVTVEAALALCSLVLVLALIIGAVVAAGAQLRCMDAAREVARLVARGEPARARSAGESIAPAGARIQIGVVGDLVTVEVSKPIAGRLPGLTVSATAVGVLEPGTLADGGSSVGADGPADRAEPDGADQPSDTDKSARPSPSPIPTQPDVRRPSPSTNADPPAPSGIEAPVRGAQASPIGWRHPQPHSQSRTPNEPSQPHARTATDRGVATVWAAGAVAALLVVGAFGINLGAAMSGRHRAEAAADLAALAAASHAADGEPVACAHATRVTDGMGAVLASCRVHEWEVFLETEVRPPVALLPGVPARGRAHAGPAP